MFNYEQQQKRYLFLSDDPAHRQTKKLSTCLTNDAKLLVLKYFGRTFSANSFGFLTLNAFPSSFQLIISAYSGFYNFFTSQQTYTSKKHSCTSRILYVLERNPGTVLLFLEALRFLISVFL